MSRYALVVAGTAMLFACSARERYTPPSRVVEAASDLPEKIDYNWDVRPVLSQNCFACHGNQQQKAGLRLDEVTAAYAPIPEDKTKRAIVPGNPGASELIRRVMSDDGETVMPPADSHKVLTARELAVLEKWVRQGAPYETHWAYVVPKATAPQSSMWDSQTFNPIDRYVYAKLGKQSLAPSPEAGREVLINRVFLDLTGLPPSLSQVDDFVADRNPAAYEHMVDRLLGSRQYAERQAGIWMDVARYADSSGFLFDTTGRYQYPYRDWVISAFQRNLPYDKFVTWQIAGDKLPNPSREQILATAFARMGKQSNEGGIIDEEYRVEYGLERTELIGQAFMGLTVGCAKCHDHKYDVISQRDFYSLFAFFNSVDERGMGQAGGYGTPMGPTLPMPTASQVTALQAASKNVAAKKSAYDAVWRSALDRADALARSTMAEKKLSEFLRRSLSENLVAYYPLDTVYKGSIEPWLMRPDGLPMVLAKGPHPPAALSAAGLQRDPKNMPSPDDGPPLSNFAVGRAIAAARTPPPAGLSPAPSLPLGLSPEKFFLSPSGLPGGKPAALHNVTMVRGIKGNGALLNDSVGMASYGLGFFERTDPFTLEAWVKLRGDESYGEVNLLYNRFQAAGREGPGYELQLVNNRLRFRLVHSEPYNEIELVSRAELPKDRWVHVVATYDGNSEARGARLYLDGRPLPVEVQHDRLTASSLPRWGRGTFDMGAGLAWGKSFTKDEFRGGAIDEIKVYDRALTAIEVAYAHDPALVPGVGRRRAREQVAVIAALADPVVAEACLQLKIAREAEQDIDARVYQLPVLADRLIPRRTYLLDHGLYNSPKEAVKPQAPDRVFRWSTRYPRNRLGLAKWLFDPKNPLTARVYVNRMWQQHFGTGIVETVEDFGTQGANPTHPELLDWLAVEFQRSGWDIKHMHKLMVMSATYRQSSDVTSEMLAKDPRNQFLARGPRYRLPAESIRDSALFASGLLVDKAGGDAVFPYQPQGVWDSIGVPAVPYPTDVPQDDLHRRSMYTFIRRNAAFPALTVFDMPDRNVSTVRRRMSSSPLQALVLLNDPQYVEAYRALAEQAIRSSSSLDERLVTVFRLATRRRPSADELDILRSYNDAESRRLEATSGEAAELAAMTMVSAAVMNSPDAYTLR